MKIRQKLRKLPPPVEIVIGGVIVALPPWGDPTDFLGAGLIAHGIERMKGETRKFNGKKYAHVCTTKTKEKALEIKKRLVKNNHVRITPATKKHKRYGIYDIWARKR